MKKHSMLLNGRNDSRIFPKTCFGGICRFLWCKVIFQWTVQWTVCCKITVDYIGQLGPYLGQLPTPCGEASKRHRISPLCLDTTCQGRKSRVVARDILIEHPRWVWNQIGLIARNLRMSLFCTLFTEGKIDLIPEVCNYIYEVNIIEYLCSTPIKSGGPL